MKGAALPRNRSQLRTSSGKETLRRCRVGGNLDNFVVIDVECDTFPYVIIVDEPEPWKKKLHGSNSSRGDQRVPFEGVISIDDEEDDEVGPSGIGGEGHTRFESSGTSSRQSNYGDDVSILWGKRAFTELSMISISEVSNEKALHTEDGNGLPSFHKDIINDREKLKETDEYKCAIEEEWVSRQQQLQIQAEKARRLKKRKKAETLRLLDMERRQKQRVEEVRETQKKDEEHINLKEKLRAEIRNELTRLEYTCVNMASILRGLGIPVEGGSNPTSNEVHTGYKRALLRFHPDRASRTDVRQQVEAEEKFKLICRMKEKYLS